MKMYPKKKRKGKRRQEGKRNPKLQVQKMGTDSDIVAQLCHVYPLADVIRQGVKT
jgi:hypothetical protein